MAARNREASRRAALFLDEFKHSHREWDPRDFEAELATRLSDLAGEAFSDFVAYHAREAEAREHRKASTTQRYLFPEDGILVVGQNKRVALKYATLDHLRAAREVEAQNAENVNRALRRTDQRIESLAPYFVTAETVYHEALAAYLAANPGGSVA